jgi:predicted RNA binding protein YcfA (HicA-like mRNA interferase family)
MSKKIRELKAILRKAGFSSRPGKGSHTVWIHPALFRDQLTLSGGDGDDARPYQENDVREILSKLREVQDE